MAKSGPQRYPGASTAYWHQSRYGGDAMESNVVVWHTTEGTSVPSYGGGASAPNFTALPDFTNERLVWYQHFDFDVSSRALVNKAGGVATNTLNVVQVEIVGTCDPATHRKWGSRAHLYTPELPDWAIRDLATFAKWAHEQHGVPLTSGVTFKAYPSSYGNSSVRMSNAAWSNYRGHCGHQHVPENDHGDPGLLPMAAILARAAGKPTNPPKQEDDMDALDVLTYRNKTADEKSVKETGHRIPDFYGYVVQTHGLVRTLTAQVGALTATVGKLAEGGGLDAAEIKAAAEAGAQAALAQLGDALKEG
ncbi:hypothetical protein [Streptomyces sp. NPDC048188]|uniref:hypothetical protein n=1 Tax=Streptomyces sp. NPDC048188 TaxID=3155749 RepID=UPI0034430B32